jgi:predicted O-methyltransferase YrrM
VTTRWDLAQDVSPEEVEAYKAAATSPEDAKLFAEWTADLPLEVMPGLGPHSLPAIREAMDIVRPASILEIGFGAGASASMFLRLSPSVIVHSVDLTNRSSVLIAAAQMTTRWHGRFWLVWGDSTGDLVRTTLQDVAVNEWPFDMAFIDGGHDLETVLADLATAKAMGINHVLMDDWWPCLGPGVRRAVEAQDDLRLVRQWGNIVLLERRAPGS